MKAMVLAAGLGTRLRPLTYEIPKPMVPVLDRPVMAHIVDLCRRQGFDQLIANLHYFPDTIRAYFGDSIAYRYEEALSDLGNCGIYCFSPEIFDYFPASDFVDWANDVFPVLLANDVPFYIHEIDEYWNDVGSLDELRSGTFDALEGRLHIEVPEDG